MLENSSLLVTSVIVITCIILIIITLHMDAKSRDMQYKYECLATPFEECENTCCKFCLGINECQWSCDGDPEACRLSVKKGCK
jgi:hypothetical protein